MKTSESKLPEKCSYADKYLGYMPPRCYCLACLRKWNLKNEED